MQKGDVRQKRLRPTLWWALLPVAACAVAALVIVLVNVQTTAGSQPEQASIMASQRQMTDDSREASKADAVADQEGLAAGSAAESAVGDDAVGEVPAGESAVGSDVPYKTVTLESGVTYSVTDAVADAPVYNKLEDATALDPKTSESAACVVADGQYVRFEGNPTWYKLEAYRDE